MAGHERAVVRGSTLPRCRRCDGGTVSATVSGVGTGATGPVTGAVSPLGSAGCPVHVGRSAPSAEAIGSTACGSAARLASGASGPRVRTDTIPTTMTAIAETKMTAVVPTRSEIGPTMMIGRKLATDTSIPRTPNTRPRTSSGRSSWSPVWAGMATSP